MLIYIEGNMKYNPCAYYIPKMSVYVCVWGWIKCEDNDWSLLCRLMNLSFTTSFREIAD